MARESTYPVRKLIYLTDDMAAQVAEYRFAMRLQSENEAIRRLIQAGLDAKGAKRCD